VNEGILGKIRKPKVEAAYISTESEAEANTKRNLAYFGSVNSSMLVYRRNSQLQTLISLVSNSFALQKSIYEGISIDWRQG
jgi:hypothetical protein